MLFHSAHRRRSAFTLVEMLVASALIIFMMWIISSAFQKGLEAFSTLKTAGDMQEKLRGATTVIRRDLTRPHFAADGAFHGEDLSDQRLDDNAWGNDPTKGTPGPPLQGYFRIFQSGNRVPDGVDPDDPTAMHFRVADTAQQGDVLQFTIKQRGTRRDQTFTVDLKDAGQDINPTEAVPETPQWGRLHRFSYPTNARHVKNPIVYPAAVGMGAGYSTNSDPSYLRTQFTTTWAEVTYFLRPSPGETTGTQQRFNLYRRQNLLVNDFGETNGFGETVHYVPGPDRPLEVNPADPRYSEISTWFQNASSARVNSQKMVTAPIRRFGVDPTNAAGTFQSPIPLLDNATDLVLTDVIDFEVKVMWEPNPDPTITPVIPWPQTTDSGFNNPDFPFDRLPTVTKNTAFSGQRVFDTWSQRNTSGAPDDYVGSGTPLWNGGYGVGAAGPKSIPLKIRVRGVQIELRVWDQKSQTTRQITIIQDL